MLLAEVWGIQPDTNVVDVLLGFDGESAGARTQDQRLKRAMLYQLSYALEPLFQVSTFGGGNSPREGSFRIGMTALGLGRERAVRAAERGGDRREIGRAAATGSPVRGELRLRGV